MYRILICTAVTITSSSIAQVLEYSERFKVYESIHGERIYEQTIDLGPGSEVQVRTEITSKGNGSFHIKNLEIRNFDQHDDAAVFQGDALKTEFIDLDHDGYRDLILSGSVIYSLEDVSTPIHTFTEPVVWIYLYDHKKDRFELSYRNASFSLNYDGGPTTSPFYLNQGSWAEAVEEENTKSNQSVDTTAVSAPR